MLLNVLLLCSHASCNFALYVTYETILLYMVMYTHEY